MLPLFSVSQAYLTGLIFTGAGLLTAVYFAWQWRIRLRYFERNSLKQEQYIDHLEFEGRYQLLEAMEQGFDEKAEYAQQLTQKSQHRTTRLCSIISQYPLKELQWVDYANVVHEGELDTDAVVELYKQTLFVRAHKALLLTDALFNLVAQYSSPQLTIHFRGNIQPLNLKLAIPQQAILLRLLLALLQNTIQNTGSKEVWLDVEGDEASLKICYLDAQCNMQHAGFDAVHTIATGLNQLYALQNSGHVFALEITPLLQAKVLEH